MNRVIITVFLFTVFSQYLFSEDFVRLDDTTLITKDMVSPTDNAEARDAYNQGTSLMNQNQYKEAERYFLMAIELDNKYAAAMDHLGFVYRRLERYEEAKKMYLLSIETNSNNIVPYINLAVVYQLQDRSEDARQAYLKAQNVDENDPEPYYGIGALYQMVGQYDMSIAFMDFAIQKYAEKESYLIGDAFYIQGDNYFYKQEYAETLEYYNAALSLSDILCK
jgi:Flp pilus assembly protein TadD